MTSPFLGHAGFGLRWGQTSILNWNIGLTPISFVLNKGQALIPKWDTGLSLSIMTCSANCNNREVWKLFFTQRNIP